MATENESETSGNVESIPEKENAPVVPGASAGSAMGNSFKQFKTMLRGEGKFDGRDRNTWAKLLIFYFFYYIAIILLFILVIWAYYKAAKAENNGTTITHRI